MISSLKGRIALITIATVIANILLYSMAGDEASRWINYATMMVCYPIVINTVIENHIDNEVLKEVDKRLRELNIR